MTNTEDDTVLKALVDLAENAPKYLRPAIDDIFNLCLQVGFDGMNDERNVCVCL